MKKYIIIVNDIVDCDKSRKIEDAILELENESVEFNFLYTDDETLFAFEKMVDVNR